MEQLADISQFEALCNQAFVRPVANAIGLTKRSLIDLRKPTSINLTKPSSIKRTKPQAPISSSLPGRQFWSILRTALRNPTLRCLILEAVLGAGANLGVHYFTDKAPSPPEPVSPPAYMQTVQQTAGSRVPIRRQDNSMNSGAWMQALEGNSGR